jgi:prepilin-type N-terminal cleavage/methylation domain-containing protein
MLKVVKGSMRISIQKIYNFLKSGQGFSLIEILVALMLAALVFLAIPTGDSTSQHRKIKSTLDNLERSIRFATNESVLRNTVVRLRITLDKSPIEYTVEFGPAGNLPLPERIENKNQLSLAEQKAENDKQTSLNQQFTKVEEFEDIKQEISEEIVLLGVASTSQKELITSGDANIYFYPTGEKDGALIFLATEQEMAYLEIEPFINEFNQEFIAIDNSSVAKIEDILQTKMDEVYQDWKK